MKKNIIWYLCATSILACLCVGYAVGQQNFNCQSQNKSSNAPKYRIGHKWRTSDKPSILFIQISIEPVDFSSDRMIALARKLNSDFVGEQKLAVTICDDYELAKSRELSLDIGRHERLWALRGFYELDRTKGDEILQFSTERGKSLDEVKIDIRKATSNNMESPIPPPT